MTSRCFASRAWPGLFALVCLAVQVAPGLAASRSVEGSVVLVQSQQPVEAYVETLRHRLGDKVTLRVSDTLRDLESRTLGSGIVLDDAGHILTTQAALRGGSTYRVQLGSGEQLRARLVGSDGRTGLAVLEVPQVRRLRPTPLSSRAPGAGSLVTLLAPAAREAAAGSRRVVELLRPEAGYFTLDGPAPPGASGAAALDAEGRVAGIVTAVLESEQGVDATLVLSAPAARAVAAQILTHRGGRGAWLGVVLDTRQADGGARILRVQPLSPAESAGLRTGDRLVRFRERPVRSGSDLVRLVRGAVPGEQISMEIVRQGTTRGLTARLGSRPVWSAERRLRRTLREAARLEQLGVTVQRMTPGLMRSFGAAGESGLLVAGCEAPADGCQAGLQAGDVIVSVNGQNVPGPDTFAWVVDSNPSSFITLQVFREGRVQHFGIEIPSGDRLRRPEATLHPDHFEILLHRAASAVDAPGEPAEHQLEALRQTMRRLKWELSETQEPSLKY